MLMPKAAPQASDMNRENPPFLKNFTEHSRNKAFTKLYSASLLKLEDDLMMAG
ncbi:hypothetical protein D3C73_1515950 [compost metagenome]